MLMPQNLLILTEATETFGEKVLRPYPLTSELSASGGVQRRPQPVKMFEGPEVAPVFFDALTNALSHLKYRLQKSYEQAYPGLADIIQSVIHQEENQAWSLSSVFPHLFLPDLVEEHMAQLGLQPTTVQRALPQSC